MPWTFKGDELHDKETQNKKTDEDHPYVFKVATNVIFFVHGNSMIENHRPLNGRVAAGSTADLCHHDTDSHLFIELARGKGDAHYDVGAGGFVAFFFQALHGKATGGLRP